MTALTARENAKHFPDDPVWQDHCERVAAYLEAVEATGKEPQLSPEAEAQVARALRRFVRREQRERRERLGWGRGNPEAYNCCTGDWETEGPFVLWGSDRGGRL